MTGPLHVCDAGDNGGPDQLRQVVAAATDGQTVTVDPFFSPTLTMGEIAVNQDITIAGQGIGILAGTHITADTSGMQFRVFHVGSVGSASVTFTELTVSGGHAPDETDPGITGQTGGGIEVSSGSSLMLDTVKITANHAGDGGPGMAGIPTSGNPGGPGGNGGIGGGVSTAGSLTLIDSTIADNFAGAGAKGGNGGSAFSGAGGAGGAGGIGGSGGGIAIFGSPTVTVSRSTISGNHAGKGGNGGNGASGPMGIGPGGGGGAGGGGGGIVDSAGSTLSVINSTLAENIAGSGGNAGVPVGSGGSGASGGGLLSPGEPHLMSSTIAGNQAGSGGMTLPSGSGAAGDGGGIDASTAAHVSNILLSSNVVSPGGTGPNCHALFAYSGHNLAFPGATGCPPGFISADPQLGPLAFNGGPTETMALGAGSAALDQVPASGAGCLATDQRSIDRPQGPLCDIGAFELEVPVPNPPPGQGTGGGAGAAAAAPAAAGSGAARRCKKKRKLKRGRCVRKKRKR